MANECPVCYESNAKCTLVCGHSFCMSCVKTWYMKGKTCPMCRRNMHYRRMPVKKWNEEAREQEKISVFHDSFENILEELMEPLTLYINDIIHPIVIRRKNVPVIDLQEMEITFNAIKDTFDADEIDYILNDTDLYFSSRVCTQPKVIEHSVRFTSKRTPKSVAKKSFVYRKY